MTPFPQSDDEDEKWKALLGMETLSAPALSDPAMQPEAIAPQPMPMQAPAQPQPSLAPDTSHWQALAGQLPDPPTASYDPTADKGGLILAAFADALLNKGRSIPTLIAAGSRPGPDVDMENYKRQRQHALDQAQVEHLMQARQGEDPRVLAMRERGLQLQERGLDLQEKGQSARLEGSQGAREAAIRLGADPAMLEGMSDAQVNAWKSAITSQLRQQGSNEAWNTRNDVRVGNQIDAEGRAVGRELNKEGREQDRVASQSVIPGWKHSDSVAPTKETATDAREIVDALGEVEYAAGELTKLHGELGKQAALGKLNALIGSDVAAQKVSRAQLLHQKLLASERKLQNMGVPQRYELEMLEGAEPQLTSLDGIINAGNVYPTVAAEARAQAARRLKVFGYEPDDAPASRETKAATGGSLGVTTGALPKVSDVLAAPEAELAAPKKGIAHKLPNGKLQLPSGAMVDDTPQARARYEVQ